MKRAELLKLLQQISEEILEQDCAHVNERHEFIEIGLDSMGTIELIDTIEKRLEILIPDSFLFGVRNVGHLLDVVEKCDGSRDYWTAARLITPL